MVGTLIYCFAFALTHRFLLKLNPVFFPSLVCQVIVSWIADYSSQQAVVVVVSLGEYTEVEVSFFSSSINGG